MPHTPGPWDRDCPLSEPHLLDICMTNPPKEAGNPVVLAVVQWDKDHDEYPTLEEANANARLIAAAPELLAACEQVIKDFGDRLTGKTVLMLRAAIAKAKGA